jgi:hypothetical protein
MNHATLPEDRGRGTADSTHGGRSGPI